jgi:hypothetical protein
VQPKRRPGEPGSVVPLARELRGSLVRVGRARSGAPARVAELEQRIEAGGGVLGRCHCPLAVPDCLLERESRGCRYGGVHTGLVRLGRGRIGRHEVPGQFRRGHVVPGRPLARQLFADLLV